MARVAARAAATARPGVTTLMPSAARLSLLARLAAIALVGLAMVNPALPGRAPVRDLIVLFDRSASVDVVAAANAWREARETVARLPNAAQVAAIDFAATPTVALPMRPAGDVAVKEWVSAPSPPLLASPLDPSRTDMAAAIEFALSLMRSGRPADILLISDGEANQGDTAAALARAAEAGVRTFVLPVASRSARKDVRIDAFSVPATGRAGEPLPVFVALLSADGPRQVVLDVAIDQQTARSEAVDLAPGTTARREILLTPDRPGELTLTAAVRQGEQLLDERRTIVVVDAPAVIVYVGTSSEGAFVDSLRRGGRDVVTVDPRRLRADRTLLSKADVIVLDNVMAADLSNEVMEVLEAAVRHRGAGLIVAGGPRAFGAGGYRHSRLEALLPVTAEPPGERQRSAVQFVVDRSGSMDEVEQGATRYAEAVRAVRETTQALEADDLVGLIVFDAEAETIVPLGAWRDKAATVESLRRQRPLGGTRIVPALAQGISALAAAEPRHKLLVVVTDGVLAGDEDVAGIARDLHRFGIDLLTILIGAAPPGPLAELSQIGEGRLLRVSDTAELPRLMRAAVDEKRQPVVLGATRVLEARSLPFMGTAVAWPELRGYNVVRPRAGTHVALRTPSGEPLFTDGGAGLGRVVVLSGGIGAWAEEWPQWPLWGRFVGGLVDHVAPRRDHPRLDVRVTAEAGALVFEVDAVDPAGNWVSEAAGEVVVERPDGDLSQQPLTAIGPGRFRGTVAVTETGRYRASLRIGDDGTQRIVLHEADLEMQPTPEGRQRFDDLVAAGRIIPLPPGGAVPRPPAGDAPSEASRPVLVLAALGLYAVTVVAERAGGRMAAALATVRRALVAGLRRRGWRLRAKGRGG